MDELKQVEEHFGCSVRSMLGSIVSVDGFAGGEFLGLAIDERGDFQACVRPVGTVFVIVCHPSRIKP